MRHDMLSSVGLYLIILQLHSCIPPATTDGIVDESLAVEWYERYEDMTKELYWRVSQVSWDYLTNLTDYNKNRATASGLDLAKYEQEVARNGSQFAWEMFTNQTLKRLFKYVTNLGIAAMKNETKLNRLFQVMADMEQLYSTSKVTIDGQELDLEPGLEAILSQSRDYNKLTAVWEGWRDAVGRKLKPMYTEFVKLYNEAIRDAGHEDAGLFWRNKYEELSFRQNMANLYIQLAPFYKELHAYVRNKLKAVYGAEKFPKSGHIPAHLLGNMWAQDWMKIFPLVKPYDKDDIDITQAMVQQNYTPRRMFDVAEEFFTSIGLPPMPQTFWNRSMLVRPDDGRQVVCHASAWDFYKDYDVRIKMCTEINTEDLITVHHEMGHIEYYLLYNHQPLAFRGGANPGFHEAIGDVIKLSVLTPTHLQKINLTDTVVEDHESDINFLLKGAMDEIVFLPFGYLMDRWRWGVFSGDVAEYEYNRRWWEHRCQYQGVSAPVQRTEDDFDPGAKYHIPSNTPYVRYFVATILKFQFHKALCTAANHTGPLHKCDIYRSREAGTLLRQMLSVGASKPWPEVLKMITGQPEMNAGPLVEYFGPLIDWLKAYNVDSNEKPGWDNDCPNLEVKQPVVEVENVCDSSPMMAASLASTLWLSVLLCMYIIKSHQVT